MSDESDAPDPARVVADADVLAADLLVGGDAREALDHVRRHSWVGLVVTDPLLADAEAVVAEWDGALAADHREKLEAEAVVVDQDPGDHPALAAALHGNAAHLLTYEESLQSAQAGASLRAHLDVSVKAPAAFSRLFDAESLYEAVEGGAYPGPDRDPRA